MSTVDQRVNDILTADNALDVPNDNAIADLHDLADELREEGDVTDAEAVEELAEVGEFIEELSGEGV